LGFGPSTRYVPKHSATGLSTGGTSLGVLRPCNARGGESPRPTFVGPPVLPGSLSAGPTPQTTVSLTGFLNLSATSSSPYRPTIFRWVAFLGLALQGFSFHEAPPTRRRAAYPLDVSPASCAIPVLGRGTRRRGGGYLECFDRRLLSSTGSSSSWKSISHPDNLMNVVPDLPLLGFHLLMVCTRAIEEGFPPRYRRAWRTARRRLRATRCPPRLSDHPGRPSLTTGPSHLKVPRLQPPPSLGVPPARAYRPCDLSPRPAVPRRRDPCVPLSAI
jgi:hypothetical protein